MSKNKLGPIPDSHFENEPTFPAKNVSPLSQYWIDRIAAIKRKLPLRTNPVTKSPATESEPRGSYELPEGSNPSQ